jgi:hypothetical protein
MATVRFSLNPEDPIESVIQAVGAATVTKRIELTVDQTANITDASAPGGLRAIRRGEVVIALQNLLGALERDQVVTNATAPLTP